ncbi:tRNA (adenosine(37)-N6)-threonylcarbamoyltransferase complex dimerization subunit type 1 TsaB [Roseovarius phycicola]|uniref:tRNA (Adenosine(37)-N6)-threonylcarbamoyltransferase complex dimerization subunit type 1 TsaB n=1 Tax=Roseovarius phycicola TaxID=3080976 RepID=A0ABZ2HEL6_9RHOB
MNEPPLILGFDTSGPWCGAVLLHGEMVLSDFYEDMPKGQAEALLPVLEGCLERGGATWRDLSAIGVGVGPGNFTGIRISVSAARGLSLSLGVPAVGVDLLDALALEADDPVISSLTAPREHVYVAGFGTHAKITKQMIALVDVPADWAEPGLRCIGTGAAVLAEHLRVEVAPAKYAPGSAVARIAAQRWQTETARPAPLYLKPPDAAPSRDTAPVMLDHDA